MPPAHIARRAAEWGCVWHATAHSWARCTAAPQAHHARTHTHATPCRAPCLLQEWGQATMAQGLQQSATRLLWPLILHRARSAWRHWQCGEATWGALVARVWQNGQVGALRWQPHTASSRARCVGSPREPHHVLGA
eukprot:5622842-Alexandrium_andersonii.AAC.1